jgi:hypothetical protein
MQQLILGTGTAIWWLTEPHWETMEVDQAIYFYEYEKLTVSMTKVT